MPAFFTVLVAHACGHSALQELDADVNPALEQAELEESICSRCEEKELLQALAALEGGCFPSLDDCPPEDEDSL